MFASIDYNKLDFLDFVSKGPVAWNRYPGRGERRASTDHTPPPARIRNNGEHNIQKSVRASLTMYQKPWFGLASSGSFAVAIAVQSR
jgi:hypothetical protein